jgi:hypothetical protein
MTSIVLTLSAHKQDAFVRKLTFYSTLFVLIRVWQQCQETCPFDGSCQLALIVGFGTGNAARDNLAGLGNKAFQNVEIFVINLGDAFSRETAVFFAAELT